MSLFSRALSQMKSVGPTPTGCAMRDAPARSKRPACRRHVSAVIKEPVPRQHGPRHERSRVHGRVVSIKKSDGNSAKEPFPTAKHRTEDRVGVLDAREVGVGLTPPRVPSRRKVRSASIQVNTRRGDCGPRTRQEIMSHVSSGGGQRCSPVGPPVSKFIGWPRRVRRLDFPSRLVRSGASRH